MAWGLEARVPFLDKAFLEVAMNIDPQAKMFSKGSQQQMDADGKPIMEKVLPISIHRSASYEYFAVSASQSFRLCS